MSLAHQVGQRGVGGHRQAGLQQVAGLVVRVGRVQPDAAAAFGRMFSDTFAGIAPGSAPMFVLMQLIGAAIAFGLIRDLLREMNAKN
mgnify:CR=1 FL=1